MTLEGDDGALRGKMRFLDQQFGIAVYAITGSFDGSLLKLQGEPETQPEGQTLGSLTTRTRLNSKGELHGEWQTTIGTGGTLVLFPHDQVPDQASDKTSETAAQLYTSRADFGPVSMTFQQLLLLADEVQQQFKRAVIVTLRVGTEVTKALPDFKQAKFAAGRADFAKLFVQEPEASNLNRTVIVEFGPLYNSVMAQGTDEPWVLGQVEKIKRSVRPTERLLASRFKQYNVFNALMIFAAVAYLPCLPDFLSRLLLMGGVLAAAGANMWLQARFIPHATIYLGERPMGFLARFGASIASALLSLVVGTAAAVLAGLLQGWLKLPK